MRLSPPSSLPPSPSLAASSHHGCLLRPHIAAVKDHRGTPTPPPPLLSPSPSLAASSRHVCLLRPHIAAVKDHRGTRPLHPPAADSFFASVQCSRVLPSCTSRLCLLPVRLYHCQSTRGLPSPFCC
jgi:hypothetical protein